MPNLKPDYARIVPAMIALDTPKLPPLEKLVAVVREFVDADVNTDLAKYGDEGFMVGLGDDRAAVVLSRMPIPWSAVEGPAFTAWWWPEAAVAMREHAAHLLVVVAGENARRPADRLRRQLALTQFTAAVASLCDAKGIYWVAGGMVHEPRRFIAETLRSSSSRPPLELLIDVRVEPQDETVDDDAYRMFTTGMQALGEFELEIVRTTRTFPEIVDFTRAIAHHMLTTTETIEDGHTLGRSDEEKITISRATSMLDETMTVWRLDFA
jgi:hypothetical protein